MEPGNAADAGAVAGGRPLVERVHEHLATQGLLPEGARFTIALSGGIDSVVLLDLALKLRESWGWSVSAAHFDHRMREGSGTDAEWVRAYCAKLGTPVRVGRAATNLRSEVHARELRYEFLLKARDELGAEWLATAHQADDQAETVLFRILRGTGPVGLSGIPARRPPGVVRPLLPFRRTELDAYARLRGLEYRSDPTNLDLSIARNRIRHRLIPEIEAKVIPDLRPRLCRLTEVARQTAESLERFSERAAENVILETSESRVVVARSRFLRYDKEPQVFLLRNLVARLGQRTSRAGTRVALEFIKECSSGRRIELAGGVVIRRDFDRLILERRTNDASAQERALVVPGGGVGAGEAWVGGGRWAVRWARGQPEGAVTPQSESEELDRFDLAALRFPLTVRGWRPGDRIQLSAGTRKLKKLFADRRIGRSERASYPVLADRTGVLWVVGLARGERAVPRDNGNLMTVGLQRQP